MSEFLMLIPNMYTDLFIFNKRVFLQHGVVAKKQNHIIVNIFDKKILFCFPPKVVTNYPL
jgi:hypothetical protein